MSRGVRPALLLAFIVLAAAGCWPQYGADVANTRSQPLETRISSLTVGSLAEEWRVDGLSGVTSTPAIVAGVVYVGTWGGQVRAVRLDDGSLVWQRQVTSGSGISGMVDDSPLVFGNTVYAGDGEGFLHALDRVTGAPRWSRELDMHPSTRIFSSPVAVDGLIIVGVASVELAFPKPDYTFRGSIVALDAATGEIEWRIRTSENDATSGAGVSVWSSAAIDHDRKMIYIGTGNAYESPAGPRSDALLAIRYDLGEVVWLRQFTAGDVYTIFGSPPQGPDADIGAAPNLFRAGGRDLVGVGDKAGVYAALDRDTGETVWARQLTDGSPLGGIMTTGAVADGVVFVTSNVMAGDPYDYTAPENTSVTFALDAVDGSIIWERAMPGSTFGALTVANGVLFQPTTSGTLHALDTTTGEVRWSDEPGGDLGGGVAVVDGWVVTGNGFWFFAAGPNPEGGVVAYRVE